MALRSGRALTLMAGAFLIVGSIVGCGGTTPEGFKRIKYGGLMPASAKAFDVTVVLDHDSWERAYGRTLPSLEIDLVGINESEKGTWENYPVGKYFTPGNALRRDADRITLTFTHDDTQDKALSRYNPIWDKWIGRLLGTGTSGKGAKWLFVIANIPGIVEDLPGDQDPRRIILPLKGNQWPMRTTEIEIMIKSSMAVCTTPLKVQKN